MELGGVENVLVIVPVIACVIVFNILGSKRSPLCEDSLKHYYCNDKLKQIAVKFLFFHLSVNLKDPFKICYLFPELRIR